MKISRLLWGHICMLGAECTWGLMAPIGKDAMTHGISGLDMVAFRAVGGALCFNLAALCTNNKEKVTRRDKFLFALAAVFAIVCNQCCFTVGLSLTSPINASIVTTSMPIFTLVIGLLFMGERMTWRKGLGITCGVVGALTLILGSQSGHNVLQGNLLGDILCLTAQLSFACYLALFGKLISRYSVVTCMRWMFSFAALMVLPISGSDLMQLQWTSIESVHWLESAFVVFGATFVAYLLMMRGQKVLTPTQVSVYNYVQPVVSCAVSLCLGLAVLGWSQALAVALVFTGVRLVARKK